MLCLNEMDANDHRYNTTHGVNSLPKSTTFSLNEQIDYLVAVDLL